MRDTKQRAVAPLTKVISGGQSGCDQAALRAAKAAGIPTGGYATRGWSTEEGPAPWLAGYGLVECMRPNYSARTEANVILAHAMLWFGNPYSPGGRCTFRLCRRKGVSTFTCITESTPQEVVDWLRDYVFPGREGGFTLLVAGNRESGNPGIGARVEQFLGVVFELLDKG